MSEEVMNEEDFIQDNEYLNEQSCQKLQNIIKRNYYKRLERASLKHHKPIVKPKEEKVILPPIETNLNYRDKRTLFSNKIRKNNKQRINRYREIHRIKNINSNPNFYEENKINEEKIHREVEQSMDQVVRKAKLPKIVRKQRDYFEIKYETKYIDKVEKNFIQPFLNKDNVIYTEFIENKQSRIPFNFRIS